LQLGIVRLHHPLDSGAGTARPSAAGGDRVA
jgi:hypothetical protein